MRIDNDSKDKIEQQTKKQKEHKLVLDYTETPVPGHQLWEINIKTNEINLAQFQQEKFITWKQALLIKSGQIRKKVIIKQDCVYISALNKKSAIKRYESGKGSAVKQTGGKIKFF